MPVQPLAAARSVLTEFGGLHIESHGLGTHRARRDADLRPCWTDTEFIGYPELERELGQRLYPFGEISRGNACLLIDESGRVYHLMDELIYVAPTFDSALECLLLGKRIYSMGS